MEKKIDIIPFLADIVEKNTHSYQSDFSNDEARLTAAMLETYQENRTFLWMSRPCGTWCFLERDVFLRETLAHIVWTNSDYEAEADKIKAYRIIVAHGHKGDFVLGKLQRVNYGEQILRVRQNALHVRTVSVLFEDGFSAEFTYELYSQRSRSLIADHGKMERICYYPVNDEELATVLRTERSLPVKRPPRKRKPATR